MKLNVTQTLPNGTVEKTAVPTNGVHPVNVHAQPNARIDANIPTEVQDKKVNAQKPKISRRGKDTLLDTEAESALDVADSYAIDGASLSNVEWSSSPTVELAALETPDPEVSKSGVSGVSSSGTSTAPVGGAVEAAGVAGATGGWGALGFLAVGGVALAGSGGGSNDQSPVDTTQPTLTISNNVNTSTATGPVLYTFTFSEPVTGFSASDITVTGGTQGTFTAVSSTSYTLSVVPTAGMAGTLNVSVASAAALDSAGNGSLSATASQAYDTVGAVVDTTPPTLTLSDNAATTTVNGPVLYTFDFSEQVTGFDISKITVTGGVAGSLTQVGQMQYTLLVTPNSGTTGTINVSVAAGAVSDVSGNASTAAVSSSQAYDTTVVVTDTAAPTLSITDDLTSATANAPVTFTFTFNEAVQGFAASDITLTGGTAGTFTQISSNTYTLVVTPNDNATGTLSASVAAGTVADLYNNGLATTQSSRTVNYDTTHMLWSVESLQPSVNEDGTELSFVISRTGPTGAATINFTTAGGTATAGSDYTLINNQSISFLAGETTKTVRVSLADDAVVESNETVVASISNASTGSISTSSASTIINDNEQSVWSVVATTDIVDEGAGTITYTVSRTGATGAATLNFSTSGGTAASGSDYTALTQTLSFVAGETSKTIQVAVTDDTLQESNETVVASISALSSGTIATGSATATINDNEQSVWSVATSTPSVDESAGFITYTVSRTGATGAATINFATAGGSATGGSDYTALTQTLTFAAGEISKTIQIAVTNDTLAESNETVVASISSGANSGVVATSSATSTINDDDQSVWSVSTETSTLDEGAGFITYTVSRTGSTGAASINFTTAGGTATAGTDYTATVGSQVLTFAAGETSKTVQIAVADDAVAESNETVVGVISGASSGTTVNSSATTTIVDNEQTVWNVAAPTEPTSEGAGFMSFVVSRSNANQAGTIDFWTSTVSATPGQDFTSVNQTLSFAIGETSKTVQVAILQDTALEYGAEDVAGNIGNASFGSIQKASSSTSIVDDDNAGIWSVSADSGTVDEGAGFMTFTVSRSGSLGAASIDFATSSATALAGTDYTAVSQTLTFAQGEATKTVRVAITNDIVAESTETVTAVISNPTVGSSGTSTATSSIVDNDQSNWSVTTADVTEGAGYIAYTISRTGSTSAASIEFSTAGGSATAGAGNDYTANSQQLSFAAGELSKTVLVAVNDDNNAEENETVVGVIASASTGNIEVTSAKATITDNEQSIWNLVGTTVAEGTAMTVTVSRTGSSAASTIKLLVTGHRDGMTDGVDLTTTPQTLTFAAGEMTKIVSIASVDDALKERLYEGASIHLYDQSQGSVKTNTVFANILDNDQDRTLFTAPYTTSAYETSGQMTFVVYRSPSYLGGDTSGTDSVDYYVSSGGSAVAGVNYVAAGSSGTLTFLAGETEKRVTIQLLDDGAGTGDKTLNLSLQNATSGAIYTYNWLPQQSTITGTILDGAAPTSTTFAVSVTSDNVSETSGTVAFTVKRTGDATQAATSYFRTNGGTATAGTDYTAVTSQTLNWSAGETTKVVFIDMADDTTAESTETLTVQSATDSGFTTGMASVSANILDNDTVGSYTYSLTPYHDRLEQSGVALFQVTRGGDVASTSTSYFKTHDTTLSTAMHAGIDYTAIASKTLTWAAGETTKLVAVDLIINPDRSQALAVGGLISEDPAFTGASPTWLWVYDAAGPWTATAGVDDVITLGTALGTYKGEYIVETGDGADAVTMISARSTYTNINLGTGNDTLYSGSTTDTGSAANFINAYSRYAGGAGVDTLGLRTASTFDFTNNVVNQMITGFEILDMKTDTANQTLRLSLQDVVDLSLGSAVAGTLRIDGTAGDTLNLQALGKTLTTAAAGASVTDVDGTVYTAAASAAGNASANDVTIGGVSYDVYQYTHDAQMLKVLIATSITTNII